MKKKLLFFALFVFMIAGINSVAAPNSDNNQQLTITNNNGNCISGNFVAREDGHIIGTIMLNSDCTFVVVDRSGYDMTKTTGTYSIDGIVRRGQMADINFYVNGRSAGSARLAWPEEEGLCIFNGNVYRKE